MTRFGASKFYTIQAGVSFPDALASGILVAYQDAPEMLPELRILLPTRRAGRALREAFLRCTEGRPLLLPRIRPLGDVEEDEVFLFPGLDAPAEIPPALNRLERQGLLARALLAAPDYGMSVPRALRLAAELGRLMDTIHTEGLDIRDLANLAGEQFARHWQITLDFLKILAARWPSILAERGAIDAAQRRDRLIRAQAAQWERAPPPFPVLAAGSTGSIPATALLLKTIANLPQGAVVLPGLDPDLDTESIAELDDTHPQATLSALLGLCGVSRPDVAPWPGAEGLDCPESEARRALARESMRPAGVSSVWQERRLGVNDRLKTALSGLTRYECPTPQDEAATIAVILRETLETPGKTAALVTPDRDLARRVAAICRRWGIALDDSAGSPLRHVPVGAFLVLCACAVAERFAPAALLSVLGHTLCAAGQEPGTFRRATRKLERQILRGLAPGPGFAGLHARVKNRVTEDQVSEKDAAEMSAFLDTLESCFAPMTALGEAGPAPFETLLEAHLRIAETLAATDTESGAERLWRGEDGEEAAAFLISLREAALAMPPMSLSDYVLSFESLFEGAAVRPVYGAHPRLAILGQLEARMIRTDRVILAGLNEGVWPPDPGHDPWMSRPMRRKFGLPGPERSIGLAAHDFVAGFCAPEVFLTRSRRRDGAPTVPARWLQRLDVVLQAHGVDPALLSRGVHDALARMLDAPEGPARPFPRPEPRPPLSARPRRLSATRIETWLRDPYAIYARSILGLEPLEPIEKEMDAAMLGTVLHAALDRFASAFDTLEAGHEPNHFLEIACTGLARHSADPALLAFWKPRLERLGIALTEQERTWRACARLCLAESRGAMTLEAPGGPFVLSARADRIDRMADGFALIDYKSGGAYTKKAMQAGELPQLVLEALILEHGGFPKIGDGSRAVHLAYWVVSGRRAEPLRIVSFDEGEGAPLSDIVATVHDGLMTLIRTFDDPDTPYYSIPRPGLAPRFNDYEHLARIREWAALDAPEEPGAEAA